MRLDEFYNDITCYLDNYIIKHTGIPKCDNNYFVDHGIDKNDNNNHIYVFRVPGASRGRMYIDCTTNTVTFIEVYGDFQCTYPYSVPYQKLTEKLQKFIGKNFDDLNNIERRGL